MNIVILALSWLVGVFGFSQIFTCLFFAIPILNDMKKQGVLHKDTPVYKKYLIPALFWIIIISSYITILFICANRFFLYAVIIMMFTAIISFFNFANNNDFNELFEQNKQYMI